MIILSVKDVRTRKAHRCYGCGLRWAPGTPMTAVVCSDGRWLNTCHWCAACVDVGQDWLNSFDEYEGDVGSIRGAARYEWLAAARRHGMIPALCAG